MLWKDGKLGGSDTASNGRVAGVDGMGQHRPILVPKMRRRSGECGDGDFIGLPESQCDLSGGSAHAHGEEKTPKNCLDASLRML
jgi:hypothetical protein